MNKLLTVLATVVAFTTAANAAPKVSAYEACLVQLVKAKGYTYVVNHAGSTVCDKR
jgi:hypothetical protein